MAHIDYNNFQLNNAFNVNDINGVNDQNQQLQPLEETYQELKNLWDNLPQGDKAVLNNNVQERFDGVLRNLRNAIDTLQRAIQDGQPQAIIDQKQREAEAAKQAAITVFNGNAQTIGLNKCIEVGHFLAEVPYDELKDLWDHAPQDVKDALGGKFQEFVNEKLNDLKDAMQRLEAALERGASPDEIAILQGEIENLQKQLEGALIEGDHSIDLIARYQLLEEIINNPGDYEVEDYNSLINQLKDPNNTANIVTWEQRIEDAKNRHSAVVHQNVEKALNENLKQAQHSVIINKNSKNAKKIRDLMANASDALLKAEMEKDKYQEELSKLNDTVKKVYEEGSWRPKTAQEMAEAEAKKRLL
ncbi:MAG: hypothetical protein MJ218_03785 [Opitutales bacterium]|nr:hypothetical protein [Opitutales bacterium]